MCKKRHKININENSKEKLTVVVFSLLSYIWRENPDNTSITTQLHVLVTHQKHSSPGVRGKDTSTKDTKNPQIIFHRWPQVETHKIKGPLSGAVRVAHPTLTCLEARDFGYSWQT
ncbi:hypothetical protein JTE90_014686 [Oedothorax gibbosus]|uniref:Uncharacterized protein n=1 Tax=Oedothorax gibbosus TaxID=931172 RepID=A0AAV6TTA0_9ARAC|nr:hypothetical protein JTE90_014686 [Oedothorax gibbosus]